MKNYLFPQKIEVIADKEVIRTKKNIALLLTGSIVTLAVGLLGSV